MEKIKSYEQIQNDLMSKRKIVTTQRYCCKCAKPAVYTLSSAKSGAPRPHARAYCEKCMEMIINNRAYETCQKAFLNICYDWDVALDELESKGLKFDDPNNLNVLNDLHRKIHTGEITFASRAEIKTAIILGIYGIKYEVGAPYEINGVNFPCDFRLPDYGIILEIDGAYHGYKDRGDQYIRDENIRAREGLDWEVIRLSTDYVDKFPFQITGILSKTKRLLKQLRSENEYGLLPPRYSEKVQKLHQEHFTTLFQQPTGEWDFIYN